MGLSHLSNGNGPTQLQYFCTLVLFHPCAYTSSRVLSKMQILIQQVGPGIPHCCMSFLLSFSKICLYERERERTWEGEGWGEGEADSPLSTVPDTGLNPRTLISWPELESRVRGLTDGAFQAPQAFWISNELPGDTDAVGPWLHWTAHFSPSGDKRFCSTWECR